MSERKFNAPLLEQAVNQAIADHNRRQRREPIPEGQEIVWAQQIYVSAEPFLSDGTRAWWLDEPVETKDFCGTAACIAGTIELLEEAYQPVTKVWDQNLFAQVRDWVRENDSDYDESDDDSDIYVDHDHVAAFLLGVEPEETDALFAGENSIYAVVREARALAEKYGETLNLAEIEG